MQLVDDKGRVAIPAALRATLEKNSGATVDTKDSRVAILSAHESDRCLIAYDEPYFDLLFERLSARAEQFAGNRGEADSNIMREGIGPGENIAFDPSGRFILPGFLGDHAGVKKSAYAFFYGVGNVIEIWDPKTLLEHPKAPEIMKSACRYHLAEKKVAL